MRVAFTEHGLPMSKIGEIHVSEPLPDLGWAHDNRSIKDVPRSSWKLKHALLDVPGVEGIGTGRDRYQLTVYRGGAFSWHEVLQGIYEVLHDHFKLDGEIDLVEAYR